jgi:hypothetical protein
MLTPDEIKELEAQVARLRTFADNNVNADSLTLIISDVQAAIDVLAWHDMVRAYRFLDDLMDYYLDVYTWYKANMPKD